MASRKDKELDHEFRMRVLQVISTGWRSLLLFLAVVSVCLALYYSVRELAGRQTLADLSFKAIADLKANRYFAVILPWILSALTGGWALGERSLRKQHIRRVSSESSEMQKKINPGRRSSNLMLDGETRPEDI